MARGGKSGKKFGHKKMKKNNQRTHPQNTFFCSFRMLVFNGSDGRGLISFCVL
jgi:hypothetical protein